jgi:hypothetical protein
MDEPAKWVEVVGVRFEQHAALAWYRAAGLPAQVRSWIVAEREGREAVGQVVIGRGQCLGFPGDPDELPRLIRAARAEEIPAPRPCGGRHLLESLPIPRGES